MVQPVRLRGLLNLLHLVTASLSPCLKQGLAQEALAEKTNLHRTYISLIERKSCNISMRIFMELAYALELSPTELLELSSSLAAPKKKKS
jgi:transcriptional regulator with XRE-family HTH domain